MRRAWLGVAAAFGLAASTALASGAGTPARPLDVRAGERLLVLAPHPDDESIGAGGLVQAVLARGGSVRLVIVTAGDGYAPAVELANDDPLRPGAFLDLGRRRLGEARAAARALGGDAIRVDDLGFPDGALASLLGPHFPRHAALHAVSTGASAVPYPDAFRPGTPYTGEDLRDLLVAIIRESRPTLVALPDPADQHPDHATTGRFGLLALVAAGVVGDPGGRTTAPAGPLPRVVSYLVHWNDHPAGWQLGPAAPRDRAPLFLPAAFPTRGLEPVLLALAPAQVERKHAAIAAHDSEERVMRPYLESFARATEPFLLWDAKAIRAAVPPVPPRASVP